MADINVAPGDIGAYEIQLTAGEVTTVTFHNLPGYTGNTLQVSVHSGNAPVYVKPGNTVTARDPKSVVVNAGTWLDIDTGYGNTGTISLTSDANAIVSVART